MTEAEGDEDLTKGLVYIETKEEGISEPEAVGSRTYRDIFLAYPTAQAIWVWRPEMREPFRVPWQIGLYGRKNKDKKEKS